MLVLYSGLGEWQRGQLKQVVHRRKGTSRGAHLLPGSSPGAELWATHCVPERELGESCVCSLETAG